MEPRLVVAQGLEWAPSQAASSSERLLMEQVDDLRSAGEVREALSTLQKLYDQAGNSLVESEGVRQLGTLKSQRFIPLRRWCLTEMSRILAEQPAERDAYLQQVDHAAQAAFANVQRTKDPTEAKRAANRYLLSSYGDRLLALSADLYLERGWPLRALETLQRSSPSKMRYRLAESSEFTASGEVSLPWWYLWEVGQTEEARNRLLAEWLEVADNPDAAEQSVKFTDTWARALLAAALEQDVMPFEAMLDWGRGMLSAESSAERRQALEEALTVASQANVDRQSPGWSSFAGDNARSTVGHGEYDLGVWPAWHHQLERHTAANDRIAASQPRVGERERGTLPYHPVVAGGRVYINEMNRIRAYDLASGKLWPSHSPTYSLFDSQIAAAAYVPLGYPLVGSARGTVSVADDCLYARMGSPVTGWANREMAEDGGSLSYLIGLDLIRQGSLIRGFPLRLLPPVFNGAEFEGCPLVWGQWLLVAIVERDNVGVRRSVAAFDRLSGELRWRSPVLASGVVEGSDRANLITHQLLTMAGGRLYYNTDLGAIVCLDPLTGEIEWLQRYQRNVDQKQGHLAPDRFKYRDLTPCMVADGLVYCMPRDCGELFALDACTGDLVWATDDVTVADAIHVLGVVGDSLLISGDRLVWLDRRTGRFLQAFPGSTTPGMVNALPSPRGMGRGAISGEYVYWPVAGEVLVFEGDVVQSLPNRALAIHQRYRISSGGSEGGNLIIADGHLIFCSPSRIMAFASTSALK